MPDYSKADWTETKLLDERKSTVLRLERNRKELLDIDRALSLVRVTNGAAPKQDEVAATT